MNGVSLYIEGVKIDLSDKEGINIKLNTQDINDISKVNAGYSKDFSVMATKINNEFFKHYYNADIIGGFDARTKKSATIYLDDLFFISGKIRLTSTSLENNLIVSYRIQFEGDVVNVKDLVGDRKLKDLDLSIYDHTYDSENVRQGLQTSLFDGSVIYPMISSVNRWLYDSSNVYENTENSKNIHFEDGNPENGISYNELKPAIRVADIVNKIQEVYNLDFVGDFFNRDYYTKLYLWFSNDAGKINVITENEKTLINWDSGSSSWIDFNTDKLNIDAVFGIGATIYEKLELRIKINVEEVFNDVNYSFSIERDGEEIFRVDGNKGGQEFNYEFIDSDYSNGFLSFFIQSESLIQYDSEIRQRRTQYIFGQAPSVLNKTTNGSIQSITGNVVLKDQAPDIKQIDIITGLLKMFNIALTAQVDGSILWETLPEFYQNGKVYRDFEKYIDIDKTIIKRGKLISEFDFKYQDPSTILAIQFKKNNIDAYGDLTKILTEDLDDPDSLVLDGGKLDIELPFENMVYERLRDLSETPRTVNIQYGLATDESLNPVVPKNLIFYNNNQPQFSTGFVDDSGVINNLGSGNVNYPNHNINRTIDSSQALNFSSELSVYSGGIMSTTLYSEFYEDYISDMFSDQRRVYTMDAIIPNFILANLKLNDRLIIQNTRYIINSINSNLTTGKTKLELLNDIYDAGDLIGDKFYASRTFVDVGLQKNSFDITVYNKFETDLILFDEGDGIFASLDPSAQLDNKTLSGTETFEVYVEENLTGLRRVMSIICSNSEGKESFKIAISQEGSATDEFCSIDIKWDNTNITLDKE